MRYQETTPEPKYSKSNHLKKSYLIVVEKKLYSFINLRIKKNSSKNEFTAVLFITILGLKIKI